MSSSQVKFKVPVGLIELTQAQRDALPVKKRGMHIWNIDANRVETYDGTKWIGNELSNNNSGLFMFINGGIPTNSRIALQIQDVRTLFTKELPNSRAYCVSPPTQNTTFNIFKETNNNYGVATNIGQITFAANANNGVFSFPNDEIIQQFDMIYVVSPNNTFTMEDLFINMFGLRL